MTTKKVFPAIAAVMGDLSKEGIGKNRKNEQQRYTFRGIDDVYNELAPVLAKHKLLMLPRIISREVVERQSTRGMPLFYVTVEAEFDLVSAEDGSQHTIRTYGEAMDSADKATNKAMSAAYKYAAVQAFCIPTEGDNDADATTPDVAPRQAKAQPRQREKPAEDSPFDEPSETEARISDDLKKQIMGAQTLGDLDLLKRDQNFREAMSCLPPALRNSVIATGNQRWEQLNQAKDKAA